MNFFWKCLNFFGKFWTFWKILKFLEIFEIWFEINLEKFLWTLEFFPTDTTTTRRHPLASWNPKFQETFNGPWKFDEINSNRKSKESQKFQCYKNFNQQISRNFNFLDHLKIWVTKHEARTRPWTSNENSQWREKFKWKFSQTFFKLFSKFSQSCPLKLSFRTLEKAQNNSELVKILKFKFFLKLCNLKIIQKYRFKNKKLATFFRELFEKTLMSFSLDLPDRSI